MGKVGMGTLSLVSTLSEAFQHSLKMVVSKRTLTLLSLVVITLSSVTFIDGFRQTCPELVIVELTNVSPDSSGFVDVSGSIFPPESIHYENDQKFGCICDIKACVPLCCPDGKALGENGCVDDKFTPGYSDHQEWWFNSWNYSKFVDNPCERLSLLTSSEISGYELLEDNSILLPDDGRTVELGSYCVFREPNSSSHTLTLICQNYLELVHLPTCFVVSSAVSILFMLATLVLYCVIPKLKNLQGWILQGFLVSYICGMIVFQAFRLLNNITTDISNLILGYGVFYFGLTSLLWLNVMSFEIQRRFRACLQSRRNGISKKLPSQRLAWYSIYAWGASAGPPANLIIVTMSLQDSYYESIQGYFLMVLTIAPILCIIVSTSYFYISTAWKIRQFEKKSIPLAKSVDEYYQRNKEWFILYRKLFVVMVCHLILWLAAEFLYNHYAFAVFVFTLEALKGVYVFLIFVRRDDVKRSFKKRYFNTLRQLGFFLPHDSITVADKQVERF